MHSHEADDTPDTEPLVAVSRPAAMPMTIRILAVLLLLAGALVAAVAACGLLPPGAVPEPLNGVLVRYEAVGGECPEGPCGFTAEIRRDGTVMRSDRMEQTVDAPSLARLVEQVGVADWEAILATPFEGECPRNVDGQESIYTFHLGPEPVEVASCSVAVDPQQEPFRTVQGILFGVGG
jgi:hypothetical protein